MNELGDFFKHLHSLHTDQRELNAIWLTSSVQTSTERTHRITVGDLVKIQDGELVDCVGEPTHKIILCIGTLYTKFEITCIDLKTNQPCQIKL